MSLDLFPSLPGLDWGCKRTPLWSTSVQQSVSGKQSRRANFIYPLYKWSLPIQFLRSLAASELQTLMGFYNARNGMFDSFLYADPTDNTATSQLIGIGDGVTTVFQLVRTFGNFIEPITAPNTGSVTIQVGGAATAAFTVDPATGLVTFSAAPAVGATITASFSFYWPVCFCADSYDFEEFLNGFWSIDAIEFQSTR